jgi:hypothetical protein
MNSANKFRAAAIIVGALIAVHATTSFFSEVFSPGQPTLPTDPSKIESQAPGPDLTTIVSPFRADLEGNHALTLALRTVRPGTGPLSAADAQKNAETQEVIKRVLKDAPHRSELWLVLALLQTQRKSGGQQIIEALKMSYFTAPNDARLMPLRLYTAALSEALEDADLKELARGDVRLMLLRQSDLRPAVSSAFFAGSNVGKKFLEDAVQSIDPQFTPLLRK